MASHDMADVDAAPITPAAPAPDGLWRRFCRNRLGLIAAFMLVLVGAGSLLVPVLPIADPIEPDYDQVLSAPSSSHVLGTDLHGRDQFSRTLWASRTSLLIGVVATGLALLAGTAIAGAAVYGGRVLDPFLMRTADVFLSFPAVVGAISVMAVLGPGRRNVLIAIAFFSWPVFARLIRSSMLVTREMPYVKAARGLGAGEPRILFRHILPNSISPVISYSAMAVASAILAEAGLSFINLGVQRPHPSWGLMLADSMGQFESAPWLVIVPGLAVTLTALTFILAGAAFTRTLDPRASETRS